MYTEIKLHHHKTSGGAEYLSDKFIECEDGSKEGDLFQANYIVRLDGEPVISVRRANLAPELLEALELARGMLYHNLAGRDWNRLEPEIQKLDAAIAKAKGGNQ